MQAGKLRERVYLLTPVLNDWGERTSDYEVLGQCRAEVIDKTGDLVISDAMEQVKSTIEVIIRKRPVPDGVILAWNDRFYLINYIVNDTKRRWITMTCEYKPQQDEYSVQKALRVEKASDDYHKTINEDLPEVWQ